MTEFALALFAFLLSHSVPARPALRGRLVAAAGERGYLVGYSALSLALLAWLISAAARAPLVPLWYPGIGAYHLALAVMPFAFALLVGGAVSPNPLSVSFSRRAFDPARPGIVGVTRHPILWAFALWSFAHALANGDLVSVVMFGGFGLFALAGMALIDRRKRRQTGTEWERLAAGTSVLPFAALLGGRASPRWPRGALAAAVLGGLAAYATMLWAHPLLFGVDPAAALPALG